MDLMFYRASNHQMFLCFCVCALKCCGCGCARFEALFCGDFHCLYIIICFAMHNSIKRFTCVAEQGSLGMGRGKSAMENT